MRVWKLRQSSDGGIAGAQETAVCVLDEKGCDEQEVMRVWDDERRGSESSKNH